MAGDWMKIEHNTPDKPEVLAIASRLKISPDEAFGVCFRMWRWFDQHTADGNARGVTLALLDRYLGVTGFAQAAFYVGWLQRIDDDENGGLRQPNFDYHNGESAKQRALTAKRARTFRDKKSSTKTSRSRNGKRNATGVTPSSLLFSSLSCGVLDSGIAVPESLRVERFQDAWNRWVRHREEIKKPLTPTQVEAQLKRLEERGVDDSVAVILHTITQGWQGLRAPETNNGQRQLQFSNDPRGTMRAAGEYLGLFNEGDGDNGSR